MPLMGNPSIANLLYGSTGAVETFVVSSTASAVVSSATAAASSSVNMTKVVAEQQAEQADLDDSAPLTLLLALAGLLVLCVIIAHPRFLARLFASRTNASSESAPSNPFADKASEKQRVVGGGGLWDGWWFRRGASLVQPPRSPPFTGPCSTSLASPLHNSDLAGPSPTSAAHLHPPPHIVPLLTHLPCSSSLLFTPFTRLPSVFKSSVNLAQLYLIVSYILFVAFALIWRSDLSLTTKSKGHGADYLRSGTVAMAQIPIVVALGVRGNIIGLCVGKGYEKLKIYHKIVGRVVFVASTIHAGAYVHKWVVAGTFLKYSQKQTTVCGILAFCSLLLIAISSLPWVRKAWYGVFKACHVIGIIGLLAGLCFHVTVAVPYCVAALIVYLISIVGSLTKTRLAHAEIRALPGAATTVVTIPGLRSGWRAGQHVRLRVPALGFPYGFEAHPFTIASAPDREGMVLMCKKAGDWTKRLHEVAQGGDTEAGASEKRNVTVILEGPYGGLGNTLLPSFSSTVFVAGGSGITHALALAHDLVTRAHTGVVRARTVDLVWVVRSEDAATPVMPTLIDLVQQAKALEAECLEGRRYGEDKASPMALRVQVFVTRCPASSPLSLLSPPQPENPFADPTQEYAEVSEAEKEKYAYLQRNASSSSTATALSLSSKHKRDTPLSSISVIPCRPDFTLLISTIADETIARYGRTMVDASGMCITACGPRSLVDDVREAVRGVEGYKARAVGGVEFEDEHFGF